VLIVTAYVVTMSVLRGRATVVGADR